MRVVLEVVSELDDSRKILLRAGQMVKVGRTEWADFAVRHDGQMSGVHFILECDHLGCYIKDLDSSNGTFVNGERVGSASLSDDDRITAGQTTFSVHIEAGLSATEAGVPSEVSTARTAEPTAPRGVVPTRIEYRKQQCDSELASFCGCQAQPPPGTVARLLAQEALPYLLVDFNKLKLPLPENLAEPAYLLDWLPEDSRTRYSPLLLAESDGMDLFSLIADGWGKDGLICIYSEKEKPELLNQLRRVAGAFISPSVLTPQLSQGAPVFVRNLFAGMEAVLLENDSPSQWLLLTCIEFESTMGKLGFVEKLADGD
jgi:FHA domain-containing protein